MVVLVNVDMPPVMIRSRKKQDVPFDFTSHRFRIGEQGGVGGVQKLLDCWTVRSED
jgi:hypothetical protein